MSEKRKSIEYVEAKIRQLDKDNIIEKEGISKAMQQPYFDGYDLMYAYEKGYNEALEYVYSIIKDK
ncbi:hypothetical protein [Bacteroides ndongoniae]|jgi:hypothetical protein|uniref:hypothetical protein n=1 Tax=Bacteroides ndongoniae TaxID=1903262 RepID=UPI0023F64D5C|nr:hypothetical protein [Bacteroides ndongoniae]